jgi:hypothetical protein
MLFHLLLYYAKFAVKVKKMRYLILVLVLAASTSYKAQQVTVVSKLTSQEIELEARKGHFQWLFPEGTTSETLDKMAKYYSTSFSYTFNNETKLVDVYPVADSEDTRRIMLRFLGANQVQKITVGEEEYELYTFYEKFMKFKGE